jgi:hypothetical protein
MKFLEYMSSITSLAHYPIYCFKFSVNKLQNTTVDMLDIMHLFTGTLPPVPFLADVAKLVQEQTVVEGRDAAAQEGTNIVRNESTDKMLTKEQLKPQEERDDLELLML